MAFKLPRLPRGLKIANADGTPAEAFMVWWDAFAKQIETQENTQDDLIAAIAAAQAAADAADAAAAAAQAAADTAQTAADDAQTTADAAAAAVASIEVPPTGSRVVTGNSSLTQDDYAILADATAGAITLTLPAAALALNSIIVTKTDSSINAVNTVPDTGDNLNGGVGAVSIATAGGQRIFNSDGTTDWYG